MVTVFKNVREWSAAKSYHPVSLLCMVSKVFENFVNNRLIDNLEKCGFFIFSLVGFRSSRSTLDLLTVVSDKSDSAFNKSGTIQALALDIS